jgi:uncharacterized membrane protein
MEYLVLIGILIVIVGFALKMDSILIVIASAIVTALIGGLGFSKMLETIGSSFVSNRSMAIFIVIMVVTGTLERNGLKESAAKLIGKLKSSSAGMVIGAYGIMRAVFGAFNVSFGGVAGFVRPIVMPMAIGSIEAKGNTPSDEHAEQIKGMSSGMENIAWFFCQVLFVGGGGPLLVQSTLKEYGYEVSMLDLVRVEIPIAVVAIILSVIYYSMKNKKLSQKYYGKGGK